MKIKIIDQHKDMTIDLFEEVVNSFLAEADFIVHIRINTVKDYLLRATIIYKMGNR